MSNLLEQASLVMIPSGYKEDVVYSEIPINGSGDLSFTRASNGTRVNSAGLVEVVPWNMLEYSEDFSNGIWGAQGSSISANSTTAPNGTLTADSLIESNTTDEHNRYQEPTIEGGEFTYSIYLKRFNTDWSALYVFNTAVGGVRYWVNLSTLTAGTSANIGSGIGTTSMSLESVGNGWVRASISFTNPSGACRFYVANAQSNGGASSYAGNGTNGLYCWGAQVNVGAAKPYFPTTDRLNVPRLTYQNGGGGCPSLLLEKQSTNLLIYSEQFDNANWSKEDISVTANATTSPDGTTNADKLIPNTSNFDHAVYQSSASSVVRTFSVYAKANGYNYIFLGYNNNGASDGVFFNLSNGTISQNTSTLTPSIENVGNGWYRCIVSQASWPSVYALLCVSQNGTSLNFAGNGTDGISVWGAQHEASSYPTSYIPTTSSSATRVADYTSRSGLALTNFTFAVNFKPLDYIVELFDFEKTGGGRMFYVAVQSNGFITFNSVSGGTIGAVGSVLPKNQTCKLAFSLNASTSNVKVYINGSIIGTYATNITTFGAFFGLQSFGYNPGTQIEQIAIFPSVLTDAECQSLTT